MRIILALLKKTKESLAAGGIKEAQREAGLIIAYLLGLSSPAAIPLYQGGLKAGDKRRLEEIISRRLKGEPLQYILGEAEFMSLPFKINCHTLIPRGDTECIVEEALRLFKDKTPVEAGDICCGSGAIAVSLAYYAPAFKIWAVDISNQALKIAAENACLNKVAGQINFLGGDLLKPLEGRRLDIIIANPPYIPREEIPALQKEIIYEPALALDGGEDGLDFYRRLAKESPKNLKEKGYLLLEIGSNQKEEICSILKEQGFIIEKIIKDLGQRDRGILAGLKAKQP